jgi:DnaK suppressor protein
VDTATARQRLEQMRAYLDRSIAVLTAEHPAAEGTPGYPDPADAAADLSEADRILALLQAAQSQRSQVLEAMDRLAGGRYGICTECGRPVPEGRLEARPEAARCLACQSSADRLRRRAATR